MSDNKSVAILANEFAEAYKAVAPLEKALYDYVVHAFSIIKNFHRKNMFYSGDEKFGWVEDVSSMHFSAGSVTDEGFYILYIGTNTGYSEEEFVRFIDLENVEEVLETTYAAYVLERDTREAEYKRRRKAKLEAELAELDN